MAVNELLMTGAEPPLPLILITSTKVVRSLESTVAAKVTVWLPAATVNGAVVIWAKLPPEAGVYVPTTVLSTVTLIGCTWFP